MFTEKDDVGTRPLAGAGGPIAHAAPSTDHTRRREGRRRAETRAGPRIQTRRRPHRVVVVVVVVVVPTRRSRDALGAVRGRGETRGGRPVRPVRERQRHRQPGGVLHDADESRWDARRGGWDDPPEGTPEELTRATIAELGTLFGQGGVEANAVTGPGLGPGFVRLRLAQFQDDPCSWDAEAELWESMVETYGVLLRPGAIGFDCIDDGDDVTTARVGTRDLPGVRRGAERGGTADGDGQAANTAVAAEVPPRAVVTRPSSTGLVKLLVLKVHLRLVAQTLSYLRRSLTARAGATPPRTSPLRT